jgi:hypothetical protein
VPPAFKKVVHQWITMRQNRKSLKSFRKKQKQKSKFYFNDLSKILDMKPRDAKKLINKMVLENVLEYWSSGSTSMYGLPGTGKQAGAEHED